jgi:hypothetical protein
MAAKRSAGSRKQHPLYLDRWLIEQLMFGSGRVRRFTQDSPVLPDVWLEYAIDPKKAHRLTRPTLQSDGDPHPPVNLLLTPYREKPAGRVAAEVRRRVDATRLKADRRHAPVRIIYNQSTVAATLRFEDLVRAVIPLTEWWRNLAKNKDLDRLENAEVQQQLANAVVDPEHQKVNDVIGKVPADVLWMLRVVGALACVQRGKPLPPVFQDEEAGPAKATPSDWFPLIHEVAALMKGIKERDSESLVHSIALNRIATPTVAASRKAVKADAVERVFEVSCKAIRWAVIDSGIDATHTAFRGAKKKVPEAGPFGEFESRVRATYDFSEIQQLLDPNVLAQPGAVRKLVRGRGISTKDLQATVKNLREALAAGRSVDWSLLEALLRIPHDASYTSHIPIYDHGTHVAGILGGGWKRADPDEDSVYGICPDIQLYDFRILNETGQGDEFTVMAALQFVRWLNSTNDYMAVHGVNLSLSIPHDVSNYACGRTPVCDEAERVVSSGVVVVAAAGNQGYRKTTTSDGVTNEAYNTISITDPGNAEQVITVGATHRARPHTYGVSYFSSRGPTGDGRSKPDLVAPGEKITSALPNDLTGVKDGTSMAAPHVSGAAALLMARYDELVGRPARIKQILRDSATDL